MQMKPRVPDIINQIIGNDYTVFYLFIFKMAEKTRSNNIYPTIQNTHRSDIQCSEVILHAVC